MVPMRKALECREDISKIQPRITELTDCTHFITGTHVIRPECMPRAEIKFLLE